MTGHGGDIRWARKLSRLLLERGILGLDDLLDAWRSLGERGGTDLAACLVEMDLLDAEQAAVLLAEVRLQPGKMGTDGETLFTALGDALQDPGIPQYTKTSSVPESMRAPLSPELAADRYRIEGELGAGGSGRVVKAFDRLLNRRVALKLLKAGTGADPATERRFEREAHAAALLEHPNIVPTYDAGRLPSGEAFFSMRQVRGRSLKDVFNALATGDEALAERFGFVRLLTIFQQICLAVEYAHGFGILHRDLKPDNIMIGEYGETLVTDWGLAHRFDEEHPERRLATSLMEVSGTPAYMAPEQAEGRTEDWDARTDIYGLGAILYEILTLSPPQSGRTPEEILEHVKNDPVVAPSLRVSGRKVPEEIERVCLKALAKSPGQRQTTARQVFEEVEAYLEGTRERRMLRRKAAALTDEAVLLARRYMEQKARVDDLRGELTAALERSETLLWDKEEIVLAGQVSADCTFSDAIKGLNEALQLDPVQVEARRWLANLYHARYQDAAQTRNKKEMLYNRHRVELNDPQRYSDILDGEATLDIQSWPEGAQVTAATVVERDGLLLADNLQVLGKTPLQGLTLKRGSWHLMLSLDGYPDIHYPVLLEIGEHLELKLPMIAQGTFDPRFAYIPPGPFMKGGDEGAVGYEKSRAPDLDGYLIARQPVTLGEYLIFLRESRRSGFQFENRPPKAPRMRPDHGYYFGQYGDSGRADPGWPVFGISWDDAMAYAAWLSWTTGQEYTLPTDEQWEKAARGADGRVFPWGNGFEPELCHMRDSLRRCHLLPTHSMPRDRSPFGVFGMAGSVREWCADWFNPQAHEKLTKGGSWLDPEPLCRVAGRMGMGRERVKPNIGFRLVLDLPDPYRRM